MFLKHFWPNYLAGTWLFQEVLWSPDPRTTRAELGCHWPQWGPHFPLGVSHLKIPPASHGVHICGRTFSAQMENTVFGPRLVESAGAKDRMQSRLSDVDLGLHGRRLYSSVEMLHHFIHLSEWKNWTRGK